MKKGLTYFFALISWTGHCQDIKVSMKAYNQDSLVIRWAAVDTDNWYSCSQKGYSLEVFKLPNQEQKPIQLFEFDLYLRPQKDWETVQNNSKLIVLGAQSYFGNSFQVSNGMDQLTELDQRKSFALWAADLNAEVAQLSGLRKTIPYRHEPLIAQVSCDSESNGKITGTAYWQPSLTPSNHPKKRIIIKSLKSGFELIWNHQPGSFTAYRIQKKSGNEAKWKYADDQFIVPLLTKSGDYVSSFLDTLVQPNQSYNYRLLGIDPFGDEHDLGNSQIMRYPMKSINKLRIISHELIDDKCKLNLNDNPKTLGIENLKVFISEEFGGTYKPLSWKYLAINSLMMDVLYPSSYYKLEYNYKDSPEQITTSPYLITSNDTIPPAAPTIHTAIWDNKLSVARLSWHSSSELDVIGYRIYRKTEGSTDYVQLQNHILTDTTWIDSTSNFSNGEKLVYWLRAEDLNHNLSKPSVQKTIVCPDNTPPLPIKLELRELDSKSVKIVWRSKSTVYQKELYKRNLTARGPWELIEIIDSDQSLYEDKDVIPTNSYAYLMLTKDEAGNENAHPKPLTIKIPSGEQSMNFQFSANRTPKGINLQWKYPIPIWGVEIYRREEDGSFYLLEALQYPKSSYLDNSLQKRIHYQYEFRPISAENRTFENHLSPKIKY